MDPDTLTIHQAAFRQVRSERDSLYQQLVTAREELYQQLVTAREELTRLKGWDHAKEYAALHRRLEAEQAALREVLDRLLFVEQDAMELRERIDAFLEANS